MNQSIKKNNKNLFFFFLVQIPFGAIITDKYNFSSGLALINRVVL